MEISLGGENLELIEKLSINAGDIPILVYRPKKYSNNRKTMIYYHGWSSNVENYELFGEIYASNGYQVIMPEIEKHGSRGSANYENFQEALDVIIQSVAEFQDVKNLAINRLNADSSNLTIGGHSLGGMIVSSIFTIDPSVKFGIIFNGLADFELLLESLDSNINNKEREIFLMFNPMDKINTLDGRFLEIYVGNKDDVISSKAMKLFEEKLQELDIDKSNINFTYYDDAAHSITYKMIRESIKSLEKNIGKTEYECCNKK